MIAQGAGADLVPAFTEALPMAVICELFGVPEPERMPLRNWTAALIAHTTPAEEAFATQNNLMAYLRELVERKQRATGRIDHVKFTHIWVMGNPEFTVSVSYTGNTGPHTVVTTMITSAFQAPAVGDTVDVLYDPDDEESITVEPRHHHSARFPAPPF